MALRKLAAEASLKWGLKCYPSAALPAVTLSCSRSFATVMDGLKYAESHEWVKVEGDTATIGISDFAQAELGDVVYVELPEVGTELQQKEGFGVVESVKAASDVYAPVSGTVTEVNEGLADDPGHVNTGPYEAGWLMKLKMSNPSELDSLHDSAAYSTKIQ